MTLQKREALSTVGMGILGDVSPNCMQLPSADGIHLRWIFERELGFTWYDFYLFRRPTGGESGPERLSYVLADLDGRSSSGFDLRESAHSVLVFIRFCEETGFEVSMLSGQPLAAGLPVSGRPGEISPASVGPMRSRLLSSSRR
jgi:hypothetical protein